MGNELVLDVAGCPGASRAIAIARQFGAVAWEAYIWDPFLTNYNGGWTAQVCKDIIAAGVKILPVYVPGSNPPSFDHAAQVMRSFGWTSGGCLLDVESGDDPGAAWCNAWANVMEGAGYDPGLYGLSSTLSSHPGSWKFKVVANYLPVSVLTFPLPDPHSKGADGWQFMGDTDPGVGFKIDANSMDTSKVIFAGAQPIVQVPTPNPTIRWNNLLNGQG